MDELNQVVVTGCSEGEIKFWKFKNKGKIRVREFSRRFLNFSFFIYQPKFHITKSN